MEVSLVLCQLSSTCWPSLSATVDHLQQQIDRTELVEGFFPIIRALTPADYAPIPIKQSKPLNEKEKQKKIENVYLQTVLQQEIKRAQFEHNPSPQNFGTA